MQQRLQGGQALSKTASVLRHLWNIRPTLRKGEFDMGSRRMTPKGMR